MQMPDDHSGSVVSVTSLTTGPAYLPQFGSWLIVQPDVQ
jgi:hypothetical protein